VVNVDDSYGQRLAAEIDCLTFSTEGASADFGADQVELGPSGANFRVVSAEGSVHVSTRLPGHFNVSNALAAITAAHTLGVSLEQAAAGLEAAVGVPGRFEPIEEGQEFTVLVDYAHTPEALENVLRSARPLTEGRLISVFGAGGDRDRDKRPRMGRIGAELSDLAIVTSDNPRSEQPDAIIEEILAGIPEGAGVQVEPDRRSAIGLALREAAAGDTVLIAGKGHEQGQEFEAGRKIPFDDREVAREHLRSLASSA
jgi:UDP-N-acetylmuramoyl-L-alanyl-D-glutamate--2,6-diaminopimelate ligase